MREDIERNFRINEKKMEQGNFAKKLRQKQSRQDKGWQELEQTRKVKNTKGGHL
jgi:hypothetical protein